MGVNSSVPWKLDILTNAIAFELASASKDPSLPVLGVLCSPAIKQQTMDFSDPVLLQHTRTYIYIATFIHSYMNFEQAQLPVQGLRTLLTYTLHQITGRLDAMLKVGPLAKYSQQQLRCLFLILQGLSVAILYSEVS